MEIPLLLPERNENEALSGRLKRLLEVLFYGIVKR
jgi:hypothetical protein